MSKLKDYLAMRDKFRKQIEEGTFVPKNMLILQELNYRIEILETLQAFCKTAPDTTDVHIIAYHHQLAIAFASKIVAERPLGERGGQETTKRRETAQNSFANVVKDCCERFASFQADDENQYGQALNAFVNTILPVWLQYRTSYVEIPIELEGAEEPRAMAQDASKPSVPPMTDEEQFQEALSVNCPIKKYHGKTLGDLITLDPNALKWLCTEYDGDASVRAAAKLICDYALREGA